MRWSPMLAALLLLFSVACDGCRQKGAPEPAQQGAAPAQEPADSDVREPEAGIRYVIDTDRSSVEVTSAANAVHVPVVHRGVTGWLRLDGGKVAGLVLEADLRLLQGGEDVQGLHDESRLDSAAYPSARFELTSSNDQTTAAESHQLGGLLTLRDRAVELSLPADIRLGDREITCRGEAYVDLRKFGVVSTQPVAYRLKGDFVFVRRTR